MDKLVNNAGLMLLGPFPGADPNDWQRMVDVNLMGLLHTTYAAVPHLVKGAADGPRQVADIISISSLNGRNAYAMMAVYTATKFGVTGFSEALRQELAKQHLRVSVVEPGQRRHRSAQPQLGDRPANSRRRPRRHRAAAERGHRRRRRLHRHPPPARGDRRTARTPHRAGLNTQPRAQLRDRQGAMWRPTPE
ncbi:SDR family NAD(P)-dependent oxidoreductase [Streptomyces sp. WAC 01325]|uniref:SDR family NAD(P)-dependent oxidoreductase n=1 Tax=Streptomyces sp. WAC 01325 TaxID=2203202 RepID=UPI001C8DF761